MFSCWPCHKKVPYQKSIYGLGLRIGFKDWFCIAKVSRVPCHTLVAGYYVFMLAVRVCPSIRLSVHSILSVRSTFPFDNFSIHERISFKFCICISTNNVSLGIVNGQISIIYHRVMELVNVQKNGFWPLIPLLFGVS